MKGKWESLPTRLWRHTGNCREQHQKKETILTLFFDRMQFLLLLSHSQGCLLQWHQPTSWAVFPGERLCFPSKRSTDTQRCSETYLALLTQRHREQSRAATPVLLWTWDQWIYLSVVIWTLGEIRAVLRAFPAALPAATSSKAQQEVRWNQDKVSRMSACCRAAPVGLLLLEGWKRTPAQKYVGTATAPCLSKCHALTPINDTFSCWAAFWLPCGKLLSSLHRCYEVHQPYIIFNQAKKLLRTG